ncbi:hypothetical protein U1Q18_033209 [Sarracenia purpurea var. burkii]
MAHAQFSEMEITISKPKTKPKSSLPPRRGQIKLRILKEIVKPVASIASIAGWLVRRRREDEGTLTSTSTTSHETPSGYNSDDDPNR